MNPSSEFTNRRLVSIVSSRVITTIVFDDLWGSIPMITCWSVIAFGPLSLLMGNADEEGQCLFERTNLSSATPSSETSVACHL